MARSRNQVPAYTIPDVAPGDSMGTMDSQTSPKDVPATPTVPFDTGGPGPSRVFDVQFPSLAKADDDTQAYGYMTALSEGHKRHADSLAADDPMAAGIAYADLTTMQDAFRELASSGWSAKDAALGVGLAGSVFGSYSKAASNAGYIKRFSEVRGVDVAEGARELRAARDTYRSAWLQKYGFAADARPPADVEEAVRNDFSDLLGGIRDVEDRYNWQFDRSTYSSVLNRCAAVAADLAAGGVSVQDVGAKDIAEAALMASGALRGDPNANPAAVFMRKRASDDSRISLFSADDDMDTDPGTGRQSVRDPAKDNPYDFGVARSVRQAFSDHRARNVRARRSIDDFSDTQALVGDIVNAFASTSTNAAGVREGTFRKLASGLVGAVSDPEGGQVSVIAAAQSLANEMAEYDPDQSAALAKWARGLTVDSTSGKRALSSVVTPFVQTFAAEAGLGARDPLVADFASRVYKIVKRRYRDLGTAAGLSGIDAMTERGQEAIRKQIQAELSHYTQSFGIIASNRNARLQAEAAARAAGREQ